MAGLVLLPLGDVAREREFRERPAEQRAQFALRGGSVEPRGLLGLHLAERAALHELALDGVQGGEVVVARAKRLGLGFDAEQPGDEVLERCGERDQQLRLGLGGERLGRGARGAQPLREAGIGFGDRCAESVVEPRESRATVEVLEFQSETELHGVGAEVRGR